MGAAGGTCMGGAAACVPAVKCKRKTYVLCPRGPKPTRLDRTKKGRQWGDNGAIYMRAPCVQHATGAISLTCCAPRNVPAQQRSTACSSRTRMERPQHTGEHRAFWPPAHHCQRGLCFHGSARAVFRVTAQSLTHKLTACQYRVTALMIRGDLLALPVQAVTLPPTAEWTRHWQAPTDAAANGEDAPPGKAHMQGSACVRIRVRGRGTCTRALELT